MKAIGYRKQLFVQPFDHRGSFTKSYFGYKGLPTIDPSSDLFLPVSELKTLVYRGLLRAIDLGVPADRVGVLVDTQFGSQIIADARHRGIPVATCLERSSQPIFDFEYGAHWIDHVRFVNPDILKVLVRYHPEDDPAANREQLVRLKQISDYVHAGDAHHFMFELLVPPTTDADRAAGDAYDVERRPQLTIEAIRQIQAFGIEADIWKLEGYDRAEDAAAVAAQARAGGRDDVGSILLGRGSGFDKVAEWLRTAAPVEGFIGFAVGRTNFDAPLRAYLEAPSDEAATTAIDAIAHNYKRCVDLWLEHAGNA
ncbi:MAG: DUF2090 domain-containing protein [Acidobacteriota bacterium]